MSEGANGSVRNVYCAEVTVFPRMSLSAGLTWAVYVVAGLKGDMGFALNVFSLVQCPESCKGGLTSKGKSESSGVKLLRNWELVTIGVVNMIRKATLSGTVPEGEND